MANENDLIRRGDLKQALLKRSFFPAIVSGVLEEIPAVDAVEVVRKPVAGYFSLTNLAIFLPGSTEAT